MERYFAKVQGVDLLPVWKNCRESVGYFLCCSVNHCESISGHEYDPYHLEKLLKALFHPNCSHTVSCHSPPLMWSRWNLWSLSPKKASLIRVCEPSFNSHQIINSIKAAPQTLPLQPVAPLPCLQLGSGSSGLKEKSAVMSSPQMRWQEQIWPPDLPAHLNLSVFSFLWKAPNHFLTYFLFFLPSATNPAEHSCWVFSFSFKAVVFPVLSYMSAAQLFYSAVPWFQSFLQPNFSTDAENSEKMHVLLNFFIYYCDDSDIWQSCCSPSLCILLIISQPMKIITVLVSNKFRFTTTPLCVAQIVLQFLVFCRTSLFIAISYLSKGLIWCLVAQHMSKWWRPVYLCVFWHSLGHMLIPKSMI